jgi:hypothetical protein
MSCSGQLAKMGSFRLDPCVAWCTWYRKFRQEKQVIMVQNDRSFGISVVIYRPTEGLGVLLSDLFGESQH